MAEEQKDFPKYIPTEIKNTQSFSNEEAKHEYYNQLLNKWLNYLNEIDDNLLDSSSLVIIRSIKETLIEFLQNGSIELLDTTIKQVEVKLIFLYNFYINKQFEKLLNSLIDIHTALSYVKIFYNEVKFRHEYNKIQDLSITLNHAIMTAKNKLHDLDTTLSFANLNALSDAFHDQYTQYNAERKFWGILIIIILLTILCRTVNIKLNPVDTPVISFYIIGIILLTLWIHPNLIKTLINNDMFLVNLIFPKRFIDRLKENNSWFLKIFNILIFSELAILISTIFRIQRIDWQNLKLFEATTYNINYNSTYDLIPALSIYIPLIWALWFSIKQYHYTLRLMNAYKFKMALSYAYSGYKKECDALGNTDHKEHLMHEVLTVVADDPTKRDFKDTHMPWSEVKEIFNIASKSK